MRATLLMVLLGALTLTACASTGARQERGAALRPVASAAPAAASDAAASEAGAAVYTDLIRGLIAQEQYYAALAHVQEQQQRQGASEELRFLEAEVRRHLGQTAEAERLYRSLLRSPAAAGAYRGLGLLAVSRDLPAALTALAEASRRAPTNSEIRNDYGYALLLARRYPEALVEIATAVELDPGSAKARNNLILLLILTGDEAGVKRVAAAGDLTPAALARLRRQAQELSSRPAPKRGAQ